MSNNTSPPAQYSIATLPDMARIPPDRVPALLEELPRILEQVRKVNELQDAFGPDVSITAEQMVWVDDGVTDGSKDERTIRISLPDSPTP